MSDPTPPFDPVPLAGPPAPFDPAPRPSPVISFPKPTLPPPPVVFLPPPPTPTPPPAPAPVPPPPVVELAAAPPPRPEKPAADAPRPLPPRAAKSAWVGEALRMLVRPTKQKGVIAAGFISLVGGAGAAKMLWPKKAPPELTEPLARSAAPDGPLDATTDADAFHGPSPHEPPLPPPPAADPPPGTKLPPPVPVVEPVVVNLFDSGGGPAAASPAPDGPPGAMAVAAVVGVAGTIHGPFPQVPPPAADRPTANPPPAITIVPLIFAPEPPPTGGVVTAGLQTPATLVAPPAIAAPNLTAPAAPAAPPPVVTLPTLDNTAPTLTPPPIPMVEFAPPKVELPVPMPVPAKVEPAKAEPPKVEPVLPPPKPKPEPAPPAPKPAEVPPVIKPLELQPLAKPTDLPPPAPVTITPFAPAAPPLVNTPAPKLMPPPTAELPRVNIEPVAATAAAVKTEYDVDIHRVKAGETYADISKQYLGDERFADALKAFNRNVPADRIRDVQVPPIYVLRQQNSAAPPRAADRGTEWVAPSQPAAADAPRGGYKTFTVPQGGMTMKAVAREAFGAETDWERVMQLNGKLTTDKVIEEGTKVLLPADAKIGK